MGDDNGKEEDSDGSDGGKEENDDGDYNGSSDDNGDSKRKKRKERKRVRTPKRKTKAKAKQSPKRQTKLRKYRVIISHPAIYKDLGLGKKAKNIHVVKATWLFDSIGAYKVASMKRYS